MTRRPNRLTLAQKLDLFPPVVVRLLARIPGGVNPTAITDAQIAAKCGLLLAEVRHLSRLTSWDNVDVGRMTAFIAACGGDLDNRRWLQRNTNYMNTIRGIPRYLRRSPEWKSTFEPLIQIWVQHEQGKAA